jgi:hypothetical protein
MRSVVDRNIVMRRITVLNYSPTCLSVVFLVLNRCEVAKHHPRCVCVNCKSLLMSPDNQIEDGDVEESVRKSIS